MLGFVLSCVFILQTKCVLDEAGFKFRPSKFRRQEVIKSACCGYCKLLAYN
jgi:hypothetical protein